MRDDEWRRIAARLSVRALPAGAPLVREGDTGRDLYVIVEGEARVHKGDTELGLARAGDLVGELGLVLGRPRAATIEAESPLIVAELSHERFLALFAEEPGLGLRLVEAIIGALSARLSEMTESVAHLLTERSLPRRSRLEIELGGQTLHVPTGTPAGSLLPAEVDGAPVVAALLDRKAIALDTPLSAGGALEPLTTAHWEGERVLGESLSLAVLEAARRVDPGLGARIGPSIGHGRVVEVRGVEGRSPRALAEALGAALDALVGEDTRLREEWWTADEARAHFEEQGLCDEAALLALWRHATVRLVSYGRAYAVRTGALLSRTSLLRGARIEADGDAILVVPPPGRAAEAPPLDATAERLRSDPQEARAAARHVRRMLRDQDRFLDALGVTTLGAFNEACISGSVPRLVRVVEGFHEKRIAQIADVIATRESPVRIVCIAGPSSSGKTTFIKRLTVQLQVDGLRPHGISLDDYYVDRDKTPRDARGEYDYEVLEAIDVARLQDDLARLLSGARVRTPRYDFQAGKSVAHGGPEIALGEGDVLMLEGIHGLNPRLLGSLPTSSVFRVFVCPLRTLPIDRAFRLHASDLRLLRRIVRDRHTRGATAAQSILRWPSVRAGERRHIFPHQHHADAVFDTSLVYEPSVLKVFAERYLLEVPKGHAAYTTAHRLLELLDAFVSIYPDHVPPTSILREFIGDSGFEY
jgi:uridine kinase